MAKKPEKLDDEFWRRDAETKRLLQERIAYHKAKLAEEGKIAVRHARTDAISRIKKLEHVSSDDKTRAEKDVQKLTDDHIKQIDGLIHSKEAEIMEV